MVKDNSIDETKQEPEDVSMEDAPVKNEEAQGADEQEEEEQDDGRDPEKIVKLPGASEDGTAMSFQIKDEDHTLGNSLRYIIMKNPDVEFCGYSIPHPSEAKLNLRIQTYGKTTAIEALQKGLKDLTEMCDHIEDVFREKVKAGNYSQED